MSLTHPASTHPHLPRRNLCSDEEKIRFSKTAAAVMAAKDYRCSATSPSAYLGRCQTNLEQAGPLLLRNPRNEICHYRRRRRLTDSETGGKIPQIPLVLLSPESPADQPSILRALPYFGGHWIDSVLAARHKGPPRSLRAQFCCSLNTARRRSLLSSRGSRPWP